MAMMEMAKLPEAARIAANREEVKQRKRVKDRWEE